MLFISISIFINIIFYDLIFTNDRVELIRKTKAKRKKSLDKGIFISCHEGADVIERKGSNDRRQ